MGISFARLQTRHHVRAPHAEAGREVQTQRLHGRRQRPDRCVLTVDSQYDTVLHVRGGDNCDGRSEIACNDDIEQGVLQSRVDFEAEEASSIVDGFGGNNAGNYVLTIRQGPCVPPPPPGTSWKNWSRMGASPRWWSSVAAAGLVEALSNNEWTVFAPTDDAFRALEAAEPRILKHFLMTESY